MGNNNTTPGSSTPGTSGQSHPMDQIDIELAKMWDTFTYLAREKTRFPSFIIDDMTMDFTQCCVISRALTPSQRRKAIRILNESDAERSLFQVLSDAEDW